MVPILQKEHAILRTTAKPVALADIQKEKIRKVLRDMKEAMQSQDDAVAIAAPQIGVSLKIFVVSGSALTPAQEKPEEDTEETVKTKNPPPADIVCINPEIIKRSKKERWIDEGCLSVRGLYGKVKRAEKTTLRAYDENGILFTRGASGLLSQIFQHETDHLNGILFTDKAKEIREMKQVKPRVKKSVDK